MARMITLFGSVPCTINPPIITLSPICTKERVEMLPSRAIGVGVGVTVAVGVGVAVAVGVGVRVAVGVGVGVNVAVAVAVPVAVAVAVGVAVAVEVGVGVGVPPDCTSNEPLSIRPFATRSKPGPRWSKKGGGVKFGSPESIAGLPGNNA